MINLFLNWLAATTSPAHPISHHLIFGNHIIPRPTHYSPLQHWQPHHPPRTPFSSTTTPTATKSYAYYSHHPTTDSRNTPTPPLPASCPNAQPQSIFLSPVDYNIAPSTLLTTPILTAASPHRTAPHTSKIQHWQSTNPPPKPILTSPSPTTASSLA